MKAIRVTVAQFTALRRFAVVLTFENSSLLRLMLATFGKFKMHFEHEREQVTSPSYWGRIQVTTFTNVVTTAHLFFLISNTD